MTFPTPANNLNTLTLEQLETISKQVMFDNDAQSSRGIIRSGHITLEDSLPWIEVSFKGKGSVKKGKDFCQQLADKMNIRVLFNRVEAFSDEYEVFGVMDIEYENITPNMVPKALSDDPEWAEFMSDYGQEVLPKQAKKMKLKKT